MVEFSGAKSFYLPPKYLAAHRRVQLSERELIPKNGSFRIWITSAFTTTAFGVVRETTFTRFYQRERHGNFHGNRQRGTRGSLRLNLFVNSNGDPSDVGACVDCAIDGDLTGIFSWDNRVICLGESKPYGEYTAIIRQISAFAASANTEPSTTLPCKRSIPPLLRLPRRCIAVQRRSGKGRGQGFERNLTDAVAEPTEPVTYLSLKTATVTNFTFTIPCSTVE